MAEVGAALERWQVQVYLAAIGLGVLVGLVSPGVGSGLEQAVNPLIAALLFVTFRQVPAVELRRSWRDGRFVAAVLVVNFVVVPVVVEALLPLLPDDRALRLGVLLVLLCPCVDWVVVFGGLGGARRVQLLAVTPLLLVTQLVLLPGYLRVLFGPELGDVVRVGPFLSAFAWLIAVPLLLAWLVQAEVARRPRGWFAAAAAGTDVAMVPLLAATLLAVITSQLPRLRDGGGGDGGGVAGLGEVARLVPSYLLFAVVMVGAGVVVARLFGLDAPAGRGVVFSGTARNSLVVLPLALALPDELAVAAVAVVTQTLVEILTMVVCVRVVGRLLVDDADGVPRDT
ncbi:arsenic resistance protein [Frankia sp. Ag45/Mut15]|uniref:Arsenic resistance protein n=1 Tax=Frankia umida TaxID=573489 RepID=A0ABT0JYQ6_9ACTN|nr:arsenic resistance protein [Frankia umida]MCK9876680.1 arsenic resistance protein [Frankia umida]